jgi:hypothetical protein
MDAILSSLCNPIKVKKPGTCKAVETPKSSSSSSLSSSSSDTSSSTEGWDEFVSAMGRTGYCGEMTERRTFEHISREGKISVKCELNVCMRAEGCDEINVVMGCIESIMEFEKVELPIELAALHGFEQVATRETSAGGTERLLSCLPSMTSMGFYDNEENNPNPTFNTLTLSERNLSGRIRLPVRSCYLFSKNERLDKSSWPASGCVTVLPPSVACDVVETKDGRAIHMCGTIAVIGTLDMHYREMYNKAEDPRDSNNPQAMFRYYQ